MTTTVTLPIRLRKTRVRIDEARDNWEKYNLTDETHIGEVTMPKNDVGFARVGIARTFNLGNYESLRLEVSVEMPTPSGKIEDALVDAKEIAKDALIAFTEEALGDDHGGE